MHILKDFCHQNDDTREFGKVLQVLEELKIFQTGMVPSTSEDITKEEVRKYIPSLNTMMFQNLKSAMIH